MILLRFAASAYPENIIRMATINTTWKFFNQPESKLDRDPRPPKPKRFLTIVRNDPFPVEKKKVQPNITATKVTTLPTQESTQRILLRVAQALKFRRIPW